MNGKYTISDMEKALAFLKSKCGAMYARIEIDEMGRLIFRAMDNGGDGVTITVFDEATSKMAEVTRTERLP